MSRRGVTILGLTVVGAGGYYLYTAGGDPKLAEKKAERKPEQWHNSRTNH